MCYAALLLAVIRDKHRSSISEEHPAFENFCIDSLHVPRLLNFQEFLKRKIFVNLA